MAKLIPLEEAAVILGMSADQLTELRSSNEIFGYRDGQNWKFKLTEIERFANEREIDIDISSDLAAKAAESDLDLSAFEVSDSQSDLNLADSGEIISGDSVSELLFEDSSADLIQDGSSSSQDVKEDSSVEVFSKSLGEMGGLGALSEGGDGDDDDDDELRFGDSVEDLQLNDSVEDLKLSDSVDDLNLDDSGLVLESGEDILAGDDAGDDALSFGSSSLSLAAGSSKNLTDDANLLDDDEPAGGSPSDTGKMLGASGDDLLLSEDDLFSDELSVAEDSFEESADLSSDFEDSELVIDDSDSSSEIVLDSGGSGISLGATESGISIDDMQLEFSGSDIDALELNEDDDMIVLDDAAGPDSATVMQEGDFNLTPLEAEQEFDTEGSQVIQLDDSEIYADESSATVLGASDDFGSPAMIDDSAEFGMGMGAAGAAAAGMAAVGTGVMPEAPYSMWQVLSLGMVASLLAMGGMVAYDLARNMWMADDSIISTSVLNFFLQITGMNG